MPARRRATPRGRPRSRKREELTIMSRNRAFMLAIGFAVIGSAGASARADDAPEAEEHHEHHVYHFKLYAGPAYVAPMSDSTVTLGTVTDTIKSEKHVGWNFGLEGRFNHLLGLELDYVNA